MELFQMLLRFISLFFHLLLLFLLLLQVSLPRIRRLIVRRVLCGNRSSFRDRRKSGRDKKRKVQNAADTFRHSSPWMKLALNSTFLFSVVPT